VLFKGSCELALAAVSDLPGNLPEGKVGVLDQESSPFHPVLPDMGSDGIAVNGTEQIFQGSGIHQIHPGQFFHCPAFFHVDSQELMYFMDEF